MSMLQSILVERRLCGDQALVRDCPSKVPLANLIQASDSTISWNDGGLAKDIAGGRRGNDVVDVRNC